MSFNGLVDGDYAGIISLGVDYAALGVAKKNGSYFLRTVNGKQNFDCESVYTQEIVDEKPIESDRFADDTKTVYLRYTVKRTGATETKEMALSVKNVPVEEASLEISFDGKTYENAVSYTAKAGRWVGVKNGMFVSHDNTVKNEENGFATVDYIRYSEL